MICNIKCLVCIYIDVLATRYILAFHGHLYELLLPSFWDSKMNELLHLCLSSTRRKKFPYCLVLLKRIHSNLCKLLPPLLFVERSLYTNDAVLLLYHVLQECHSDFMKSWVTLRHFPSVRLQERIRGIICQCLWLQSCIYAWGCYPQSDYLVVGSMWYCQTVWEAHRVLALEPMCYGCWLRTFFRVYYKREDLSVPLNMSYCWNDLFHWMCNHCCYIVVRSLFQVATMVEVAVDLLMVKRFVLMSVVSLCSSHDPSFHEVWFHRRLSRRVAEHPVMYFPIPYGAKCYIWP